MLKKITLTAHAQIRLSIRHIALDWVEAAVRQPDWTEADLIDSEIERRFRAIPQFGERILRVACVETETTIRVITAVFDRNARRKP